MKKTLLKSKLFKYCTSIFSLALLSPLLLLTSCSDNNSFYIANFQSYMNPELINQIGNEYSNVNFRYFSTNEDLERQFENYYDIAVPSAYLMAKQAKENLLEKINWSKFNITHDFQDPMNPGPTLITNSTEALELFTKPAKQVLTSVYDITGDGNPDNLLDYGVPYFLQDFVMGYKGPSLNLGLSPTWLDIVSYFGGKVGNGKTYNRIGLIDDYRSIYSIPRLIETTIEGSPNVNPPSGNVSIQDFQNTYKTLTDYFQRNNFLLNSDSGFILNDFANPKGSDAGIMYNGDLLYSVAGGDDGFIFDVNNVNLLKPKNTLIALDLMVINKKAKDKDLAYDLIKKIALEGTSANEDITLTNVDDEYVFGPMLNFDHVQYTSPLIKIDDFVLNGDFFLNNLTNPDLEPLCKKIYEIIENPSIKNMFELGMSDLQKSNMNYAFTFQKGFF